MEGELVGVVEGVAVAVRSGASGDDAVTFADGRAAIWISAKVVRAVAVSAMLK